MKKNGRKKPLAFENRDVITWTPNPEELQALNDGKTVVISTHDITQHDPGTIERSWEIELK